MNECKNENDCRTPTRCRHLYRCPNASSAEAIPEPQAESARSSVASGSARLPFKLTLHDGAGMEKTVGPLWLNVPNEGAWEPVPEDLPGGHWEHVARMEKWAKEQLLQDMDCSIDIEALIGPPNDRDEQRARPEKSS